jgi:hypothetical protein
MIPDVVPDLRGLIVPRQTACIRLSKKRRLFRLFSKSTASTLRMGLAGPQPTSGASWLFQDRQTLPFRKIGERYPERFLFVDHKNLPLVKETIGIEEICVNVFKNFFTIGRRSDLKFNHNALQIEKAVHENGKRH